ncbi:MAG: glycoside hydrolase family 5 protein [Wujia sp.]
MNAWKKMIVSCLMIALVLTGCGKADEKSRTEQEDISMSVQESTAEQTEEMEKTEESTSEEMNVTEQDVTEQDVTGSYGYTIPELQIETKDLPDTEGMRFAQEMKLGWNLGNTFDASVDQPWFSDELDYESAWCGAKTTPELIRTVKNAGFSTIRIPVSWHNHVTGDNYEISEAWMNRVREVVDYAIELDMYVILDIHHDIYSGNEENSLGQCFVYPTEECYAVSEKYVTCIWQQLCEEFRDYDEHLIFESLNEPRLTGTEYEWWLDPSSSACTEAVNCINRLNQCFVDVVRSSGGNNADRYLLIPGYCSSFDGANHPAFSLPQDTVEDRLMVSIHAYTPYHFALQSAAEDGSRNSFDADNYADTQEIDAFMNVLYEKYISRGIPVIIDEFGARNKLLDEGFDNVQARINYSAYYVATARANGMTCCWWDNNSFHSDGEDFGLIDRTALMWVYPDILKALTTY